MHMYAFFFDRANPDVSKEFKRVGRNVRTMSLFLLMDEHPMSMQEQLDILTAGQGPKVRESVKVYLCKFQHLDVLYRHVYTLQPNKVVQWIKDLISGLCFLQSHQVYTYYSRSV